MARMETSKRIVLGSWAATIMMTTIVIVGAFMDKNVADITTLAALSWGELTAAHGFYYWKAKNENRAKGSQKLIKSLAKDYGIDSAAQFAELIYKD